MAPPEIVEVRRVDVARVEIDYGHADIAAALAELVPAGGGAAGAAKGPFRLPLARERFAVELAGVPTAVANALRRAVMDEARGHCLTFDGNEADRAAVTDGFMADEDFVRTRVRMIPLRPQVSADEAKNLRLGLDVENPTATPMAVFSGDLVVTAGRLAAPLFNPTHEIALLQPGKAIRLSGIRVVEGVGRDDAAFNVAVRGATRPLDLAEVPRAETHGAGGAAAEQSGYVLSSLVADPRRHLVTGWIPAAPVGGGASRAVLDDGCAAIIERLNAVKDVLAEGAAGRAGGAAAGASAARAGGAYFLVTADGDRAQGVLGVPRETDTVGNLLARYVFELEPSVAYVGYTCVPHEDEMRLTVSHAVAEPAEIGALIARAADRAVAVFEQIRRGIREKTA